MKSRPSVGIATVPVTLALLGAWRQRAAERRAAALHPPGRRIVIDGRSVHVLTSGTARPVVALDSGLSGSSLEWRPIINAVAPSAQVVHVDRPGLGYSAEAPGPRSAIAAADELLAALRAIDAPAPYVLVGHSLGGLHVRVFAQRYPDLVAGLVYVDATHELAAELLDLNRVSRRIGRLAPVADALAAVGLLRLLDLLGKDIYTLYERSVPGGFPDGIDAAEGRTLYGSRRALRATFAEYAGLPCCVAEVAELRRQRPLPDVPTVVLSAGRYPERHRERMARFVREAHSDLAAQSSRSRHEIVEGAGHLLPMERPDRVVAAILEVVDAARAATQVA